ncbi:hypothetical protein SAMN05421835_12367 [Amycolatopsis sacchari]|uniref:Uncharacterized protein n=1 Tax=Amycolatopsis sacchari TaxID=115433 RepID=A0A1I4A8A6_9PSEU|nr:hypothetical protein [Amycolatopsis sacchari]SFK52638.1 hypothetical protein SAMN05421835_12367 [Amycolatopsis sacchari]
MVGTTTEPTLFAPVLELMGQRPSAAAPSEDRTRWLLRMAEALGEAGLIEAADTAREAAVEIVRETVEAVAGGGR